MFQNCTFICHLNRAYTGPFSNLMITALIQPEYCLWNNYGVCNPTFYVWENRAL